MGQREDLGARLSCWGLEVAVSTRLVVFERAKRHDPCLHTYNLNFIRAAERTADGDPVFSVGLMAPVLP